MLVGVTLLGILQDKTFHYGAGAIQSITPRADPSFPLSRTEEIQPHFLLPFNTTLTKTIIRLIKFICAVLPLETLQ